MKISMYWFWQQPVECPSSSDVLAEDFASKRATVAGAQKNFAKDLQGLVDHLSDEKDSMLNESNPFVR